MYKNTCKTLSNLPIAILTGVMYNMVTSLREGRYLEMKTWKQTKLRSVKNEFGGRIEEFKGFDDDRRVYINIYNEIIDAIESLPDEPHGYIKCAVTHQIKADKEILYRISEKFQD